MAKISAERKKRLAKERAKNQFGNYYNMKNLKKAVFRLMPLSEDEDTMFKTGQHFFGRGRPKVCPDVTHGSPCPVCNMRQMLLDLDDEEATAIADKLKVRVRFVAKIIDRENPDSMQLAEFPKTVYDEVLSAFEDDEEAVDDADEGRDFRVSKKGSGLETEYKVRFLDVSVLHPDEKIADALIAEAAKTAVSSYYPQEDPDKLAELAQTVVPSRFMAEMGTPDDAGDDAPWNDDDDDPDADAGDDDAAADDDDDDLGDGDDDDDDLDAAADGDDDADGDGDGDDDDDDAGDDAAADDDEDAEAAAEEAEAAAALARKKAVRAKKRAAEQAAEQAAEKKAASRRPSGKGTSAAPKGRGSRAAASKKSSTRRSSSKKGTAAGKDGASAVRSKIDRSVRQGKKAASKKKSTGRRVVRRRS